LEKIKYQSTVISEKSKINYFNRFTKKHYALIHLVRWGDKAYLLKIIFRILYTMVIYIYKYNKIKIKIFEEICDRMWPGVRMFETTDIRHAPSYMVALLYTILECINIC